MKSTPILFSTPMVRAILKGKKRMTRRIAAVTNHDCKAGFITPMGSFAPRRIENHIRYCRFQVGQQLWVRETWQALCLDNNQPRHSIRPSLLDPNDYRTVYKATDGSRLLSTAKWRPSIFMPKWASRITLEVTGIRLERLTDISIEDAIDEGVEDHPDGLYTDYMTDKHIECPIKSFFSLWESINKTEATKDAWVWVIEFKEIKQ